MFAATFGVNVECLTTFASSRSPSLVRLGLQLPERMDVSFPLRNIGHSMRTTALERILYVLLVIMNMPLIIVINSLLFIILNVPGCVRGHKAD